jgi:hypothetical protein
VDFSLFGRLSPGIFIRVELAQATRKIRRLFWRARLSARNFAQRCVECGFRFVCIMSTRCVPKLLDLRLGFPMTCRLYIDEVGNDDTRTPSERFLSLTGIIAKVHGHDHRITPSIEALKARFFGHSVPENIVVLHRKEIVRKERPFHALQDEATNQDWETSILELIGTLPYAAITVMIDKEEHMKRYPVWQFNPYHYCLRALIERYVLELNSKGLTGDVVIEPRFKKQDKKLKKSFSYIFDHGTENIPARRVQACLTSREIKFESKKSNICGLQLVEMVAHPSHRSIKAEILGQEMEAKFGKRVVDILMTSRYRRSLKGKIDGYGRKKLP